MNLNHATYSSGLLCMQAIAAWLIVSPNLSTRWILAQTPQYQAENDSVSQLTTSNLSQSHKGSIAELLNKTGVAFSQTTRFQISLPDLRPSSASESESNSNEVTAEGSNSARANQLESISGKVGWDRFSRKNLNAPVVTQVQKLEEQGQTVGYALIASYIVYADMRQMREQDLLESTFGGGSASEKAEQDPDEVFFEELTTDQTTQLKLSPPVGETETPPWKIDRRYATMNLPIAGKVLVQGVVRLEKAETQSGIELYWLLDPQWSRPALQDNSEQGSGSDQIADKTPPRNVWRPLTKNNLGGTDIGEPTPYRGLGGYVSVYPTGLGENQLLVQSALIIHEPNEWFSRSNFLRGKLVLSASEAAKKIRRKLR